MGQALGLDDVAFGIAARRRMPLIMLAWGGATKAMAWVSTPLEFYVLRFFIGFAEAGFFTGIVLFMTYCFPASLRRFPASVGH